MLLTPEEVGCRRLSSRTVSRPPLWSPCSSAVGWRGRSSSTTVTRRKITETQRSIAHGFAQLLATQMAAVEMETQRKLAASMELKMLQTQISPTSCSTPSTPSPRLSAPIP